MFPIFSLTVYLNNHTWTKEVIPNDQMEQNVLDVLVYLTFVYAEEE